MAHIEDCPTCGTRCEVNVAGLELVVNSGDETLATKFYTPVTPAVSNHDLLDVEVNVHFRMDPSVGMRPVDYQFYIPDPRKLVPDEDLSQAGEALEKARYEIQETFSKLMGEVCEVIFSFEWERFEP